MGDYDYAYEAFTQNRHTNAECACFPRELKAGYAVVSEFFKATFQFSLVRFRIAQDRRVRHFLQLFDGHDDWACQYGISFFFRQSNTIVGAGILL
jgi:hypothetical protein